MSIKSNMSVSPIYETLPFDWCHSIFVCFIKVVSSLAPGLVKEVLPGITVGWDDSDR